MQTYLQSQTFTITTDGVYLAVYDVASPVNKPDLWEQSMQQAKRKAGDNPTALFHFNQIWIDYMEAQQLLTWPLMFDGVYRVCIKVSSTSDSDNGVEENFVGNVASALIGFPTGTVVIGNLFQVGNAPENVMSLPAGLYEATLSGNVDQQYNHMFLTDATVYPKADGPDWTIFLKLLK